ncbi:MAG: hypothetical protein CVU87_03775 [Firmicutes bacterium HGW-Firmicutes-12]|nr:MAG: hypothetical protein CVU87_03775 [Firmicutes bacterium HGW-Firmicutes-12]
METYSEQYGNSVLASEQLKEESSTGTTTAAGENPADSNMEGTTYGETGTSGGSEYDSIERTRNYDVSKTVETKVNAPGKVTRVSISVLLDGEMTDAERGMVSEAVGKAAGIDLERGDQVSIVAMPFNTEETVRLEAQLAEVEKTEARKEYITMGLYGLGIIVAAGLLIFIFLSLKNMVNTQLVPSMDAVVSSNSTSNRELKVVMSPEAAEKKMRREQVDQLVDTNPEDVAKVIKTWMLED